ncbi:SAM domain-containing protein SAMSN-1b [Odontesthes bonariensis]|uniref:SAM domain-containing protein SAMSN-1b n=1 Tax=Odontesthes bonariensis TaxID=219752 RepID=UPI003F582252
MVRTNNAVLACVSLGRKTEKRSSKMAASPQQHNMDVHKDSKEEGVWSPEIVNYQWRPFECPQPWTPFYHTCQQARHELWKCGGSLSLPRASEWDRFESLIQEMDSKQSDMCLPQMIRSITDLHFSQNTKKQDLNCEPTKPRLQMRESEPSSQSDRKHFEASAEKTLKAPIDRGMQRDEAEKRETGRGRTLTKRQRQSRNSMESLYSLNSGQSSSSGVTSGSDCSSNRDSLRLDDDLLLTRQFCGRARVHTAFVPSPYDSESLKLKVGDVIDIIAKSPMGIWKGMLDGRIGNFKFIYVDVLMEQSPESHIHKVRHKSTIGEVLKHIGLEEYSTSLRLSGCQTVDDLMWLREHDLMELNVTNAEHRQCLLAAINSLQRLHSDSQLENEASQEPGNTSEDMKADMINSPRDSGCLMTSDSVDD